MSIIKNISRRSFLISSAACLALPTLEAEAAKSKNTPKKFLCVGLGYGFSDTHFYPKTVGSFAKIGLEESMKPLSPFIDEITMVEKLRNFGYHSAHDGSTQFLRAMGPVSADILAGTYLSKEARYKNIVLNTSDFSDGHSKGLSYDFRGGYIPGFRRNLDLYKTLFSSNESKAQLIQRIKQKRSVLDSKKIDYNNFSSQLTKSDKVKLDEYFQSIRQMEYELKRELDWVAVPKPKAPYPFPDTKLGGKTKYAAKRDGIKDVKLSYDLIALAFQSGQTNVASLAIPNTALLTGLGINTTIHGVSHYNSSQQMRTWAEQRDKTNMELFAYGIKKLKETKDVNGQNLFDNTAFICGSNLRSGHGNRDMPFFVTGGAIAGLKKGHNVRPHEKKVPLANALLTILNELGVDVKNFGQSTGRETSFLA
ncbi:DUF1552 domain-containing protein [Lentisphaera profundi]|uniref:DUF1552 domain-containing protein n=1 Tax=Lentisphaera profundi TaxID=1658616 RepID=A0ABY7VT56_9BACT|nr:DUF1552 domain-containing protein [Lentisphaera profundi]WDE96907.1 DUF1552 domain-containing protein [Lentisphaera profundi]